MEEPIPAAAASEFILKNIENLDDILPTGDLRDRHADIAGKDTRGISYRQEISKMWGFHEFACVARAVPRSEMLTDPEACAAM